MADLLTELQGNHPTTDVAYSTLSDAEAVEALYAKNRPGPVPAKDVRKYLMMVGRWAAIADDVIHGSSSVTRQACRTLVDALENFEDFDLQDTAILAVVTAGLDGLIATGHITSEQKTAILAMEDNRQSRLQELGLTADERVVRQTRQ